MRDYNLVKYIAKLTGAKPKRNKKVLTCYFPYDQDGIILTHIAFAKGMSKRMLFNLSDVYELYASQKYASYEEFLDCFVAENNIFEKVNIEGDFALQSDLSRNRFDHVASQALMNYSLLTLRLNKFLGRKAELFTENNWRELHRHYLKKQKTLSNIFSLVGFGAFAGGMVLAFQPIEDFLVFLDILLILGGLLSGIIFLFRFRHYKRHLEKALRDKNYK